MRCSPSLILTAIEEQHLQQPQNRCSRGSSGQRTFLIEPCCVGEAFLPQNASSASCTCVGIGVVPHCH